MELTRIYSVGALILATSTLVASWQVKLTGLTKGQETAIEELRERVKNDLTQPYMMEDLYMLRWLTAKDFQVHQAQVLLLENLKWRRDNNIDDILQEDWAAMDTDFPYQLDTVDKQGRPILYFSFGDWDIRKLALSGMLPKLTRYFAKMFEDADTKVRSMRAEGMNITQFMMVLNMDGYNIPQHACLLCLPFYSTLTQTLEARYPGTAEQVYFVNAPAVFEVVLRLIQNVLSRQSRETLKVYGADRRVWEPILLDFIDKDQLPRDL